MTDIVAPGARASEGKFRPYVDWPAIFAGAFVALAIVMVFTAFGSAIGLSLASPYEGPSPYIFFPLLALWTLFVTVSAFAAGGYVAGRLRRRIDDASPHEVHIRDGAHGLVLWAVAAVVAGLLAASSLGAAVRGTAEIARAAKLTPDPAGYAVDRFLRGEGTANAPKPDDAARQEVTRILGASVAKGAMADEDRAYLSRLVAARSGVAPADADRRVETLLAGMKSAADKARKVGIVTAFLTAASLALAAAAAWWGASVGGRHRDENLDVSHLVRW